MESEAWLEMVGGWRLMAIVVSHLAPYPLAIWPHILQIVQYMFKIIHILPVEKTETRPIYSLYADQGFPLGAFQLFSVSK